MKIITLFLIVFSYSVYSQNIKLVNNIFYTIEENGVKQNKKLKFEINTETIKKIKTTDKYNTVLNDKEFVNANKVKRKISSPLEVLLYALAGNSVMVTKWKVKNEVSFDFIDNSLGQFYFNENDDIMVKFYFKSKNDLGNEILSVADYNSTTLSVTISK
nr:hypothetical protein [uncultured Flavobacterium sp.]